MIYFSILLNLIEALIFPVFLSSYYDVKNRKIFIGISFLFQFIVLNLCTYYNQSGFLLTAFIILFNIMMLCFVQKKITFNHVAVVILYNFILLTCSYLGLYTQLFLDSLSLISFLDDAGKYILTCSLGKILLVLSTYILLKNKLKLSFNLEMLNWKDVLVFQGILVASTAMLGRIFILGINQTFDLVVLLALLIILNFYFFYVINKIEKLNNDRLSYQKQLQIEEFDKEKLRTIKNIKNEIDAIDHRLFYVIFEIDNLAKANRLDKIQILLNKYKTIITKHKMVVDTNNSVFDCLISLKINDLIIKDIDVKPCMFISQNESYNDLRLINFIISLLNQMTLSSFIDIDFKEIDGFLKQRYFFESLESKEEIISLIEKIKLEYKCEYKWLHTKENHDELSIVLKLKEEQ